MLLLHGLILYQSFYNLETTVNCCCCSSNDFPSVAVKKKFETGTRNLCPPCLLLPVSSNRVWGNGGGGGEGGGAITAQASVVASVVHVQNMHPARDRCVIVHLNKTTRDETKRPLFASVDRHHDVFFGGCFLAVRLEYKRCLLRLRLLTCLRLNRYIWLAAC